MEPFEPDTLDAGGRALGTAVRVADAVLVQRQAEWEYRRFESGTDASQRAAERVRDASRELSILATEYEWMKQTELGSPQRWAVTLTRMLERMDVMDTTSEDLIRLTKLSAYEIGKALDNKNISVSSAARIAWALRCTIRDLVREPEIESERSGVGAGS